MKIKQTIYILMLTALLNSQSMAAEWQVAGRMPIPVVGARAFVIESTIFVLGGYSDSLQAAVNFIQSYDPVTNRWQLVDRMVAPRYGFASDISNDSLILSCGGIWADSPNLTSLERWNSRASAISNARVDHEDVNFSRVFATGHIYRRHFYLFGGLPSPAASDTYVYPFIIRFNIAESNIALVADTLYTNNALPYHMMSVRIGSLVYLFGGVQFGLSDAVHVFDLEHHQYRYHGKMSSLRAGGTAVAYNEKIYLIGGYDESSTAINSVEIFNPNNDLTGSAPDLIYSRKEAAAVVFQDEIYVFGGRGEFEQSVPVFEKLDLITSLAAQEQQAIDGFVLENNYPNPFNNTTRISFQLPQAANVNLDIFSAAGQHVITLGNGHFDRGKHTFSWNGNGMAGKTVASGVYIYRMRSANFSMSKKMILIK